MKVVERIWSDEPSETIPMKDLRKFDLFKVYEGDNFDPPLMEATCDAYQDEAGDWKIESKFA